MKRIFIAISTPPGDSLLKMVTSLKTSLAGENIKWADEKNMHLTLAFLGDTEEKRIKSLIKGLAGICSDFDRFSIVLSSAGVFKNYRDPRVIWAGINQSERLESLNKKIINYLGESGFVVEDRPFRPHITLGRIKKLNDVNVLESLLNNYKNSVFNEINVGEIILYESILLPAGPLYKVLQKFGLAGKVQ